MKFVETASTLVAGRGFAHCDLDQKHQLRVESIRSNLIRVMVKKNRRWRLDRTWSIAQGQASVPWEGIPREDLPGERGEFAVEGSDFVTPGLRLRVHSDPYHLEWFYRGESVLKERTTGALAFGRRDHRVWHFQRLRPESRFYGLGERSGEIDRRGRRFELRNVDPMGYDARTTDPLYKHFPFYIEHHAHGFVGVFYDNYANSFVDLGQEIDNYHGPFTSYRAADGDFDLYVTVAPTLLEVTRTFSWLTGKTYLPPRWSLGYSTTSMTYTDVDQAQQRLEQFLEESARHEIPVKSFKFGSGYTSREGKRYVFTWNREKFPDPEAINQKFHDRGIRLNANIKPVLLVDHPDYEEIKPLFIRDSEVERQEISQFWDHRGSHLDFSNPATVEWWQRKAQEQLLDLGIDALWNDNNEYVIWDDEARCHGFGKPFPISLVRPLMSLWMTRASHEQVQQNRPDQRVWSISRCGSPGMHRYAQTWSGDNRTHWETLEYNNKMALGLSMSGFYNIGHDVGGFSGPDPDPELLARWFFIGAFCPRFGVNSWKPEGSITEPWMYPEALPAIKKALALRMRFLPQLYSLMAECHFDHSPLLRPTFMNFPSDERCLCFDTEFMWGENLLVAPVLKPGCGERSLYLPDWEHGWWEFQTGRHFGGGQLITVAAPLDQIPLFVRGGSALFLAENGADSIDGPEKAREVHLFPGGDFETSFYDDDGETYAYRRDEWLRIMVSGGADGKVGVTFEGSYRPAYRELRVIAPGAAQPQHFTLPE